jgi:FkbM family methyltransferase
MKLGRLVLAGWVPATIVSCASTDVHPRAAAKVEQAAVTREEVVWAYRLFLQREPENDAVVDEKMRAAKSARDLANIFLTSDEFARTNPLIPRWNRGDVVLVQLNDHTRLWVDLSDHVIGFPIIQGHWEAEETRFVKRTVREGMNVLDVGAHIGYYTMTMADLVGPSGKVIAFEPYEPVAKLLKRSVAENKFESRVRLEQVALGERKKQAQLISAPTSDNTGGSYISNNGSNVAPGLQATTVDVVALDDLALPRPIGFIKIDVEGSEPLVFRGGDRLLREDRPLIFSEIHPRQLRIVANVSPREYIAEMVARGYECRRIDDGKPLVDVDELTNVVFVPQATAVPH